jgi:endonuclease I/V8-like Glu-specific endopeptidase
MVFGTDIGIAVSAAGRWAEREAERKRREGLTSTEIESNERVQKRLDRLQKVNLRQAAMAPGEAELTELTGGIPALERTIGDGDFLGIAFVEHALAVARFVGRVIIRSSPGTSSGFGTGFMVSPRLLITNNHVLPSAAHAAYSELEFDFQRDRFNRMMPSVYFALEPQTFFMTDRALDFTLVAVAERSRDNSSLNPYGWSRLIAEEGKALIGDPLNIIQHPRGEHKQIVVRSNKLVDLVGTFAHYTTDTERGSSGSPVYNDQWEVIALHHSGVPKRDENGNLLNRSGSLWREGRDSPEDLVWVANEGIRVSALVRHIERANLRPQWAPLRRELLELEPPDPLEAARAELKSAAPNRSAPREAGSVTVTLPLRITIGIGEPESPAAQPLPPPAPAPVVASAAPAVASGSSDEQAEALAELEQASQRPYYDEEADGRARNAYWGDLPDRDLDPVQMFDVLHGRLEQTHTRPLAYKPARHLYPWVDLHPGTGAVVKSIYSGQAFDPAQLIHEDFRIEAALAESAQALASTRESLSFEAAFDALEAQLPYNCEHVVPQSWFAKKEPMRGDLHHLFTCEARCNSFRGNTPYYDFADFREALQSECGKREGERFEPEQGKGAAARATLYFLLRYPGEIERLADQYDEARLEILLAWHRQDGVSEYEHHRNAAIEEKQGNRNPLIDFPELADRIDFVRGLGGAPGPVEPA